MKNLITFVAVMIVVILFVTTLPSCSSGYDYYEDYVRLEAKNSELESELWDLKMDYEMLKDERDSLESRVIYLESQLEEYE